MPREKLFKKDARNRFHLGSVTTYDYYRYNETLSTPTRIVLDAVVLDPEPAPVTPDLPAVPTFDEIMAAKTAQLTPEQQARAVEIGRKLDEKFGRTK